MLRKNVLIIIIAAVAFTIAATAYAFTLQGFTKNPAITTPQMTIGNNTLVGNSSLKLTQTISLAGIKGRIDHMDIDIKNQRLFIAALGNDSVEVLDLKTRKVIHSITGLQEPQGILFIPEYNRVFVANGRDGTVQIFDADSFSLIQSVRFSGDADNLRYDAYAKVLYAGYCNGGLGLINATNGSVIGNIPLDGHPESFQLSVIAEKVERIYANIPQSQSIAVVDGQSRKLASYWVLDGGHANYPMALDEDEHILVVGLRDPSRLDVYDTTTGSVIAKVDVAQDPDDIFIDKSGGKIYVSCGEGFIDVVGKNGRGAYALIDHVSTASGARTSLFVPMQNRLYVAAPESVDHDAQILVFDVQRNSPAH